MEIKLEAEDLCYSYHTLEGETKALSHISFDVRDGEFFAVVGPSGCGKSTLLSLLCGLIEPEEGRIFIDGKARQDSGAVIGYMLQRDHLFEWRSILSNVSLGLEIQNRLDHKAKEELGKMLDIYGLSQFQDAKPGQLSGGMRQRAALIRTLALKPDILLLDEPFSALDYQTRLEVCDDISTILRNQKKTAILITHDLSEALYVADRVLVLSSRPAKVRHVMEISFGPEFDRPLARRNAPEFSAYFNDLWKALKTED